MTSSGLKEFSDQRTPGERNDTGGCTSDDPNGAALIRAIFLLAPFAVCT
jgi:hypothetical protein